jgi:hypothetical protein
MLSRDQLEVYEKWLMSEIARRRPLGGYSPEAGTMLMLTEIMYEITRHMREKMPMPKPRKGADDGDA